MLKQISLFHRIIGLTMIVSVSIIAYAKINSLNEPFAQARDFPEGALVYAQFQDLPALFKIWDESSLKQKYLESTNFAEFQNNHLALKLLSRLSEFEAASGFPLDVSAIVKSSETKAAIAVYDIGRLEFVFVAPASAEKLLASDFLINRANFIKNDLPDGTGFYSKEVEADRGRQKQKLLFASLRGRFVLATDEVNFLKTLSIIKGESSESRLFDAPEFRFLRTKIKPHLATVWVDQRKLNEDWYFKHYWAFKNRENLKTIRAGIFDFELREDSLIEHRRFLLNEKSAENRSKLSRQVANDLLELIPEDLPYFRLQEFDDSNDLTAKEIRNTLLDGFLTPENRFVSSKYDHNRYYFEDYSENHWNTDYKYLGGKYETEINEDNRNVEIDEREFRDEREFILELNQIIRSADPKASASLISLQIMPIPLFFECRRAFAISLGNTNGIDRKRLENAISNLAKNQVAVSESNEGLVWKTGDENGRSWRELNMPGLGWNLVYSVQSDHIIFANSKILLLSMFENKTRQHFVPGNDLEEFITIRFGLHGPAFESVMSQIRDENSKRGANDSVDFFVDNVGSLFDVLSGVNRVEIRKTGSGNYRSEELNFVFE